jgi:hypothetical protein
VKEDLVIYKELFSCRISGISKLFQTEIILTSIQSRTHSDKIQVIPMERFLEMMENFCFYFDEKVKNIK